VPAQPDVALAGLPGFVYANLFAGYTFYQQRTGGSSTQQVDVDQNRVRVGVQFGYLFNFD